MKIRVTVKQIPSNEQTFLMEMFFVAPTAGWERTPGRVMEQAARELRAHGHREDSQHLAQRAVDWYHTRRADAAARREHREDLAFALYQAERWEEARPLFSTPGGRESRRSDLPGISRPNRCPHG